MSYFAMRWMAKGWEYCWPDGRGAWLHGATLCYQRSLWAARGFPPLQVGEDALFVRVHGRTRPLALLRQGFYLGRIHGGNTSPKQMGPPLWRRRTAPEILASTGTGAGRTALVAAAAGVGDILRITPLVRALHRLGYRVDVLLAPDTPDAADLLRGAPEIGRLIVTVPLQRGQPAPPVPEIAGIRYDVAAYTIWAAPFADRVQAGRHLTFPLQRWLDRGDSACAAAVAGELGWTGALPPPFAQTSGRRFEIEPGTVALHPGCKADWPWKRWHGFAELAALLPAVVVVGTAVDRDNTGTYFGEAFRWPARVRDFTGQLSLADTAALVKACAALVTNDSGLMHLGTALDVPTIGIFGITSPAREAMDGGSLTAVSKQLDCEPECRAGSWGRQNCARALECLRTLSAEEVKMQLDAALNAKTQVLRVTYAAAVFDATGYGQAARLYVHALHQAGVRVAVTDTGAQPPQVPDPLVASLLGADDDADFHIFHGIPPYWAGAAFPRRRVIAVTVWETDCMPQPWRGILTHAIDVWLPCKYNVEVFAHGLGRTPFLLPHALPDDLPSPPPLSLDGVGPDDFVFFAMFEWQDRKNPEGTIEAFLRAFPVPDDAVLVLKCSGHNADQAEAALAAVRARLGSTGRVLIVAAAWSPETIAAFQARGDCYVSLHRGEGWGYPLFEAAARGTPVIATAYAGPVDYLDPAAQWLVRCRPSPVRQRYAYYQPSMRWAEPDLGHAAEGMRFVYSNRALARERASAAAAALRETYSLARIGAAAKARLLALAAASPPVRPRPPPPRPRPPPPPVPIPGTWYDADYFERGHTSNWERGYSWSALGGVFTEGADWLRDCFPEAHTALDIGCAKGFLVRTLRERNVAAFGIDHSPWAIDHADPAARPYLRLAGVDTLEWDGGCDLLIAMFVLESLTETQLRAFLPRARHWVRQAMVAVIAGPVLSDDDRDPTRITRRDREGWRKLFLDCGWQQDPIHHMFDRHCAAHAIARRRGWDSYVFSPGR